MPKGIFISYRRDDVPESARQLYECLKEAFPRKNIYFDVDVKNRGEDIRKTIQENIGRSQFVIVFIGPQWNSARLNDNNDFVLLELDHAIKIQHQQQTAWEMRGETQYLSTTQEIAARLSIPPDDVVEFRHGDIPLKIIPVLIGRTDFPELPASLKSLILRERIVHENALEAAREIIENVRNLKAVAQWSAPRRGQHDAPLPAIWIGGTSDVVRCYENSPKWRERARSEWFEDLLETLINLDKEAVGGLEGLPAPRGDLDVTTASYLELVHEAWVLTSKAKDRIREVWNGSSHANPERGGSAVRRRKDSFILGFLTAVEAKMVLTRDPGDEGSKKTWGPIFEEHPDTWRMLLDNEENILAYWHVAPLLPEYYAALKVGRLKAGHVRRDILTPFDLEPGVYNVFFVIAGRNPGPDEPYKRQISHALAHSYFDALESLSGDGVYIRELAADVWTRMGHSVAVRYGLKKVGRRDRNVAIYVGHIADILKGRGARFRPELFERYTKQGLVCPPKRVLLDALLRYRLGLSRVSGLALGGGLAWSVFGGNALGWSLVFPAGAFFVAYKLVRIGWDRTLEFFLLRRELTRSR